MIKESILDGIGDAIYGVGPDWRVTFFNRQAELFFGRRRADVVGRPLWDSFPAARGSDLQACLEGVMATREAAELVTLSPTTGRWFDARVFPLAPSEGIAVSWRDVTEQKAQAIALADAVETQDMLFRELTHRVANNFQEVAARLNLEARQLRDPAARDMCAKLAVSIQCMALVHRQLYRSPEGIQGQDLGAYVSALCRDLKASLLPDNIGLTAATEAGTQVSTEEATTVGMMLAELVMNARKYAWAPGEPGRIVVSLRRDGDMVDLEVRDDGQGVPAGVDLRQAAGLGLRLLERQIARLKGTFSRVQVADGAAFRLRFPVPGGGARAPAPDAAPRARANG